MAKKTEQEAPETAVAVIESTGGALVQGTDAAALAALMAEDAGDGLQNVGINDVATPYFKLLQKGNPECEEGNPKFMPDAKPGMLLDSVTNELIDIRDTQKKFAVVVPVEYKKVICVWRPNQGGKVKDLPMDQKTLDEATRQETADGGIKLLDADGNILEETAKFWVLLIGADGAPRWGIIAHAGSKLKPAKIWNNLVRSQKLPNGKEAPSYSTLYRVEAFLDESKRTGKKYQNFRYGVLGRITDMAMYKAAKDYRKAILEGTVKEDVSANAADSGHVDSAPGDDNVPF